MTRLREDDVCDIWEKLNEYNQELLQKTGKSLGGIAAYAAGVPEADERCRQVTMVAVVPISAGEGIISGFTGAVRSIVEFLGFNAFVTEKTDIAGLAEAWEKGANTVFLADDNCFMAFNTLTGKTADNGEATGQGFAAALDLMGGGLREQNVLVIGAGPVGSAAAEMAKKLGARVFVYDINDQAAENLALKIPGIQVENSLPQALARHRFLIEATPAADTISKENITEETMIATPGVPLGVDQECRAILKDRLIHDVLEIGVATMLYKVLPNG